MDGTGAHHVRHDTDTCIARLVAKVLQVSAFAAPIAYHVEGAHRAPDSRRVVWASAGIGLVVLTSWHAQTWSGVRSLVLWFSVNYVFSCLVALLLGLCVGQQRAAVAGLVERAEPASSAVNTSRGRASRTRISASGSRVKAGGSRGRGRR
ncbi:hypothetical protein ABII15_19950 [Streptomyces sp. HUAS MG91]|uniref:Uncharacterized protein n=1 Tax=Streptomyces tabacisoli TaxID=3156398 RepID=A0AAU8IVN2_9ACTN